MHAVVTQLLLTTLMCHHARVREQPADGQAQEAIERHTPLLELRRRGEPRALPSHERVEQEARARIALGQVAHQAQVAAERGAQRVRRVAVVAAAHHTEHAAVGEHVTAASLQVVQDLLYSGATHRFEETLLLLEYFGRTNVFNHGRSD